MTIDVGFAHLTLDDGTELDFVDVPGHDRLVGNMLVGAGEIDAALLVIAADDGPRAQTVEHLELLDALGIGDGLVVVTKADAVTPERLAEVVDTASALTRSTTLAGAPVLPASATTGAGLASIRAAFHALRDAVLERADDNRTESSGSRLAIDRVFTIRGRGTVVTGSLRGAPVSGGALLRVVPSSSARTVRVREVQVHGRAVPAADPGRVALNVTGEGVEHLERGMVLTDDPTVIASDRLLATLAPRASIAAGRGGAAPPAALPPDRARVALHLATTRVSGRLGRASRDGVELAGRGGTAILRLDRPIAVAPGDRFVLRRPSPGATLAGGRVIDPRPPLGPARRRATPERIRALAASAPGGDAWRAARLDLHGSAPDSGSAVELASDVAEALGTVLVDAVAARPGIRLAELTRLGAADLRRRVGPFADRGSADRVVAGRIAALAGEGRLVRDADRVRPPGATDAGRDPALAAAMDRLVATLSVASPPPLAEAARACGCPPEGVRQLEAANRIVRLDDDLAWAFPAWRDLAARALDLAAIEPLTPAAYRDATGTSRKYVMAILEDLDRRAILRRTPTGHVPGPRAAGLVGAAAPAAPAAPSAPAAPAIADAARPEPDRRP
jgi:selenocysteine-specific elongation factor